MGRRARRDEAVSARFGIALSDPAGFGLADITVADIGAVQHLPPIHGDPFDRLLISQARARGMTLVTKDATIQRYDVDVLAVP